MKYDKLIIHDIDPQFDTDQYFYAGPKTVRCKGCFDCWLRNPGKCVMADRSEHIGSRIAVTEKVIFVCKSVYGGFSAPVKRVLDRSIPGVLPFFKWIHGRMHHVPRYKTKPIMEINFYDKESMTEKEIILAEKAAKAMAINFNAKEVTVNFLQSTPSLENF